MKEHIMYDLSSLNGILFFENFIDTEYNIHTPSYTPSYTQTHTLIYEQNQWVKCFCEEMHSSVKGVFVLGQRGEWEIKRERGMTEKGSDRNYYSNSLCRCLEICSPSLLFYLLAPYCTPSPPSTVEPPCVWQWRLLTCVICFSGVARV